MIMSFDTKFLRQDQQLHSDDQSDLFLVEPDKLDIKDTIHGFLFIIHHKVFSGVKTITQMRSKHFYVLVVTSVMLYDMSQ